MVAPSVVGKPSGEVTVDMGIAGKLPYEAAGRHGDIISLIHPLYSKSEKKGGDSVVRVFASATFPRTWSCRHGRPPTSPTTAMGEAITASVRSPPSATPPPHLILEETTDRPPSRNVRKSTNRGQNKLRQDKHSHTFSNPTREQLT